VKEDRNPSRGRVRLRAGDCNRAGSGDAGLAEIFFLMAMAAEPSLGVRVGIASRLSGPIPVLLAIFFPLIPASLGLYGLGRFRSWRVQAGAGLRAVAWSAAICGGRALPVRREHPLVAAHGVDSLSRLAGPLDGGAAAARLGGVAEAVCPRQRAAGTGPPRRIGSSGVRSGAGADPRAQARPGARVRGPPRCRGSPAPTRSTSVRWRICRRWPGT